MPPLTDAAKLNAWLGRELDETRASTFLDAASAAVRHEARRTWVTAGNLDDDLPDIARMICLAVAARMFANPTGLTQRQTGPFAAMMSAQYMLETERTTLVAMRPGGRSGLGTISTTRGPLETAPWPWDECTAIPVTYADGTPNAEAFAFPDEFV